MFEGRINEACVRMSMVTGRSAGPRAARGKKKHGSRLPNFYADARESSMRIPVEEQLCLNFVCASRPEHSIKESLLPE